MSILNIKLKDVNAELKQKWQGISSTNKEKRYTHLKRRVEGISEVATTALRLGELNVPKDEKDKAEKELRAIQTAYETDTDTGKASKDYKKLKKKLNNLKAKPQRQRTGKGKGRKK